MKLLKLGVGIITILLIVNLSPFNVNAWSNGGYSENPETFKYGTHDWIAEHALDFLPNNEKQYILDNLDNYLFMTEYPDNPDGYGDSTKHHVYYYSNGTLQDNASAVRAEESYIFALKNLKENSFINASEYAGIMTHYISDVAVFGHVMGKNTDWGEETHHSDYENYVRDRTTSYTSPDFDKYLSFDGELNNISAYQATLDLAYDTTFDVDGDCDCLWMDADPAGPPPSDNIVVNEFEQNPTGTDAGNEWVELYNPTSSSIDLSNWKLKNNDGDIYSISGIINGEGYAVFTFPTQWLDNTDERVILINSSSQEIDSTPVKADGNNDNRSWQRSPNGVDTNSDSDWSYKTSTKGSSNSRRGSRAYDWDDQDFKDRCGESLNLAINLITDALHTLAWEANYVVPEIPNKPPEANIIVNVSEGYAPLSVSFTGIGIDDDGMIIGYYWDFDDGYISPEQNPIHVFQNPGKYNVTLDVRDDDGDSGIDKILINVLHKNDKEEINQLPSATIIVNVTNGPAPLSVSFKGVGTDLDGTIMSYFWDFGDGNMSNRQELNHTFQNSGEYLVNLTVTDDKWASAFDTILITVFESPNLFPIAQIKANETMGFKPLTVTFHGSGIDNDGYIVSYYWDFDDAIDKDNDGNFTNDMERSGKEVNWTFDKVGIYRVTLTVIDDSNGFGRNSILIIVSVPHLEISADKKDGFAPLEVNFTAKVYASALFYFEWDFDDGSISNERNPTHIFQKPGNYTVKLNASDGGDFFEIDTIKISVKEGPIIVKPENGINDTGNGNGNETTPNPWGTICLIAIIIIIVIVVVAYFILRRKKDLS